MIRQFSDGLVELRMSGKSCPPDFKGQAGNCSSSWFRVDNGPWESGGHRSMLKLLSELERVESVAEFRARLILLT